MELPLLVVGEELEEDEEEDEFREKGVVTGEFVACDAGRKQEDVSWCCDSEEKELWLNVRKLNIYKLSRRGTYTLRQGDEHDVEDEHPEWAHVIFHNLPSVVLRSNRIPPFAPVVESQSRAPQHRNCHNVIQPLGR
jgi:hypothetical protein